MTEEEAKTKWCPFARDSNTGGNRCRAGAIEPADFAQYAAEAAQDLPCIGSACMAWRWADEIERRWTEDAPEGEGWQRVQAAGGVAHWARTHKTPHGYCGLAGQP